MCLAAAVHTARLHEGHLSRYIILSAPIFLFTLPHLLSIFTLPPSLPSSPRFAASPTGVTDLILFSHRALTSLSGASLPLSSVLLFSSPLASAKLLDGEKARCDDLKPSASRQQRWDKHVGAFRRLIFPPPPSAEHGVFSADCLLTEGHSSHFTQISR